MQPVITEERSVFVDNSVLMSMVAGAICAVVAVYFWQRKKPTCANPFTEEHVKDPGPIETNQKRREQILRQGFTPDKVPKNLDAIIIGSGIGGLCCAGIMARAGKKVLVLEQHDRTGGCTHTYEEKGFEFDIGLHYIGQVHDGSFNHTLLDVLSDGQLVWETLAKEFDTIAIRQPDGSHKLFTLKSGKGDFEKRLIEMFPDEEKAILEYSRLMRKCSKSVLSYISLKILPKWFIRLLVKFKLFNWWTKGYGDLTKLTLQEVLDKLTNNKELKVVLGYSFGDYGTIPSKAPFFMHGMLTYHFYHACYYPRGGASEIAFNLIPGILRPGGNVLVRAPVSTILFEGKRAVGVRVSKGGNDHDIYAPLIISNAGAINTYGKLIPSSKALELGLKPKHTKLDSGLACTQVLVGLRGSAEELQISDRNYWIHSTTDPNKAVTHYLALAREDAANEHMPILFVSFPSTKDSTWYSRHPGKSVCVIVTFSNWEWFAEWKNERVMKRGPVYNDLKRAFQDQVLKQLLEVHPQLKDKIEFIDSGTPVSHRYYIDSPKGEIYGVDHAVERFQYEVACDLRPKTSVEGLYLTGQDVMTGGITAAALGGLMTASTVLDRNVFTDLVELMKSRKMRIQKKM